MIEIITGVISGIVSGIGMGGGTILILILSIFVGMEQKVAQATNLIFFIPTSIAAIFINFKKNNINLKIGKIVIFFGCIRRSCWGSYSTKNRGWFIKKIIWIFFSNISFI